MSKNRKNRMKRLAGAVLGASAMFGGTQPAARADSNLQRIGVGAGVLSSAAMVGLLAKTMFGKPKDDWSEKLNKAQYDALIKEKDSKEKAEKLAELRKQNIEKYGLSEAKLEKAATLLNEVRGDINLDKDKVLDACADASVAGLVNKACKIPLDLENPWPAIASMMDLIQEEIGKNLTLQQVQQAANILADKDEKWGNKPADDLVTVAVKLNTPESKGVWTGRPFINNRNLDYIFVEGCRPRGKDNPPTERQLAAGDALLTPGLKKLLQGGMPAGLLVQRLGYDQYELLGTKHDARIGFNTGDYNDTSREKILASWDLKNSKPGFGGGVCTGSHQAGQRGLLGMGLVIGRDLNASNAGFYSLWGVLSPSNLPKENEKLKNQGKQAFNCYLYNAIVAAANE